MDILAVTFLITSIKKSILRRLQESCRGEDIILKDNKNPPLQRLLFQCILATESLVPFRSGLLDLARTVLKNVQIGQRGPRWGLFKIVTISIGFLSRKTEQIRLSPWLDDYVFFFAFIDGNIYFLPTFR